MTRILCAGLLCCVLCCGVPAAEGEATGKQELNRVQGMVDRADLILVGQIMRVGPPPRRFSGSQWVSQRVEYKVVEMLAGTPRLDRAKVDHPIVFNSPDATKGGRLVPLKYHRGKRLIIFLERRRWPRALIALGPSLEYNEASLELLRKAGLKW